MRQGDIVQSEIASTEPALVVDVDGTLLRTDLLVEAALTVAFRAPWKMLAWPSLLARGKAPLKRAIAAQAGDIGIDAIPLNEAVVDFLTAEKARGRKIYLASASDEAWIAPLSARLDLFDGHFASDGATNLAGEAKAAKLVELFGRGGFDYIGNGRADLPVWAVARKAYITGAPAPIAAAAAKLAADVETIAAPGSGGAKSMLKAWRPHQWVKNVLVFLPMLAAQHFDAASLMASLLAFVAMSLCASSGYVVNDLADLASDRRHLRKRRRPFASGALPPAWGVAMALGPLIAGLALAAAQSWQLMGMVSGYYLLSLTYSFALKSKLILDVFALAFLYTFRIGVGAVATGVVVSEWLFAFAMFFFMSLAMVKRANELARQLNENGPRTASRGYHPNDVEVISALAVAAGFCAVLVLALYVNSPAAIGLYSEPRWLWGACFVLAYWLGRIFVLARRGHLDDDPIIFAFSDRASIIAGAGVALFGLLAAL